MTTQALKKAQFLNILEHLPNSNSRVINHNENLKRFRTQ